MDKRSLYDGLNQLESELRNTLTELVEMKHALHEIVEKNTTLEMENQRLREHLRELNQVAQAPAENVKQELSKSRILRSHIADSTSSVRINRKFLLDSKINFDLLPF